MPARDVQLRARVMADDIPVLLLHGQPGSIRDWERLVSAIDGRATLIALDRPGWDGHSPPADLQGNVDAAVAALERRGIDRATVVGHSLGGAVAAWLAADHPERVSRLVLAAPAANLDSLYALDRWLATPVAGYLASVAALAGLGLALTTGPVRRHIADELALDDRYLQAAGRRLLAPAAWRAFVIEQRALIRDLPVLESRLKDISAPTTIIAGSADRIVPVHAARRLAGQIPGAELVLLPGAGHLLPQRHPQRLAEVILAARGGAAPEPLDPPARPDRERWPARRDRPACRDRDPPA
jgi:pimeloyl-ACP methyl ester carboxylesterase